ncbi:MAG: glycosyltransferase family 39 protein [Pirellulaceae bacterium]|nr:glycosyltransferase family 39 protein [Pirellulaceae bacterium]
MVARRHRVVVNGLLAVHALLLAWSAAVHSPVIDEPAHLSAGISHWHHGTFSLYRVNPPLARMVATVPLLLTDIQTDWSHYSDDLSGRPEFAVGDDLVVANGMGIFTYAMMARWACIPFSLLGGIVCYHWGRLLFGRRAGLVALTLWCSSPTILGHGALLTPDVAGTSLGLAACYLFSWWLVRPSWRVTLLCGVVLGLAECAKSTWIVLFVLFPLLWLAHLVIVRSRAWKSSALQLGLVLALGWFCLLSIYAFDGFGAPVGSVPFKSKLARRWLYSPNSNGEFEMRPTLAKLPLPLPRDFVAGLDHQYRDLEGPDRSYLRGAWRTEGWWYYYLYGLAVKEHCGVLILAALSSCLLLSVVGGRKSRSRVSKHRKEIWLASAMTCLCPVVVLAVASANTGMNHHVRYVMPVVPYLLVLASGGCFRFGPLLRTRVCLTIALAAYAALSSLVCFPHSLSYFNEFAGGPSSGIFHLNNSNIDWGQDLLMLRDWKRKNAPDEPLYLAYFGRVNPSHAGIDYHLPPQFQESPETLAPGWYGVSVTLLQGRAYSVESSDGKSVHCPENAYSYFGEMTPDDRVGHSIFLFHVARRH